MTDLDALELVSALIGSFAMGYGVGYITVYFQKMLDQI